MIIICQGQGHRNGLRESGNLLFYMKKLTYLTLTSVRSFKLYRKTLNKNTVILMLFV